MATCLISGAAGFIGSHVTDCLIEAGHRVIAIDDLSGGFRENVNPAALFLYGSIVDGEWINNIVEDYRIEYIYHLAAYAAEGLSHFIRRFNYTNNLLGSVNLINAAVKHKVKCFVFTSSIAVLGSQEPPFTEKTPPKPEDPYGISKLAVELDLKAAHKMWGLPYVIFRPANVFGPRQNIGDPYRNVAGIFMNQILQGKPCTVFGDGTQTRAFTYVGDVAPVIAKAPFDPACLGKEMNICGDQIVSVNELARIIQTVMGKMTGVVCLPARKEAKHAYYENASRAGCVAASKTTLYRGIQETVEWVKKHGSRQGKPFENIEIEEGLPESWKKA